MNSCIYQNVCKDFNTPACKTCEHYTLISHYKPRQLLGVPVRTWYPCYRDVTAGDSVPGWHANMCTQGFQ